MSKQETAIEWLYEQIKNINKVEYAFSYFEAFEQAKAMEKEQTMNAHNQGYADGYRDNGNSPIDYYNETYGK
jgi:hypothetical protein